MKINKLLLGVILLSVSLFAELQNIAASPEFLKKDIPVIDVRTPGEWKQTGIVKGAHTIMFFDERGGYNVEAFLKALNQAVDTKKPFALICRTGSRTAMISDFLDKELHYNVINLTGGMVELTKQGYQPAPYEGK
jgi:rhodanese-related sulfurtransferase